MRNLRMLSPVLRRLMPGLEVKDVLAELAERVIEECDYELEASSHRRIARHWRRHPFVRVPAVDTAAQPPPGPGHASGSTGSASARSPSSPTRSATATPRSLYRFYYANAGELDIALGDPHPGNYLLCDDGRVAFFDFGMIRELPRGYLRREGEVLAAIRDSDADGARPRDARARLPARALGRVGRRR